MEKCEAALKQKWSAISKNARRDSSQTPSPLQLDQVCKPVQREGRRVRALHPWAPQDRALWQALNRGKFKINEFRNRDLRALLFKGKANSHEQKRRSAALSRKLALLRGHGLIRQLSGTHR